MQFGWNIQTTNTSFDNDNDPLGIQYFAHAFARILFVFGCLTSI